MEHNKKPVDLVIGKCYMAKENKEGAKDEYVGKFVGTRGGGRTDVGMANDFMIDDYYVVRVHRNSFDDYIYTETECKGSNTSKSRKNRKQRKARKTRKQRKPLSAHSVARKN